MSYQAYLDALEARTGSTPQQLLDLAAERGYGPTTTAGEVVAWLKDDFGVGRGHAMAFYGVLKNGSTIARSTSARRAATGTPRPSCGSTASRHGADRPAEHRGAAAR